MQSPTFEYVSKGWTCWKGQNLKRDHSVIAVLPFVFFINLTKEAVPKNIYLWLQSTNLLLFGEFFFFKGLENLDSGGCGWCYNCDSCGCSESG